MLTCWQVRALYAKYLCWRDALGRPSAARDDKIPYRRALDLAECAREHIYLAYKGVRACLITLHSNFEIFQKEHPAVEIMLNRRIFER